MRRFVLVLPGVILFLCFFSPLSIGITSLGEKRANFSAFRTFVRFVLVWFLFPLPLGVWKRLRLVIVALPGLFSYLFIPHHTIVAGYYGFTLDVRVSAHPTVHHLSVRFSFPDDNLSKYQWIFTKLGMCIDIVEIWFGIPNGQISSNFYRVICPRHAHIFCFRTIT